MSDMTVSAGVPEVNIGSGSTVPDSSSAVVIGGWGDMAKDMAALEKETGIPVMTPTQPEGQPQAVVTPPVVVAPTPTAQTQPQTAPQATAPAVVVPPVVASVEVPEKFRGADGKLDQEKLLKSYGDAEKALKQAQNKLTQAPAPVAPQTPAIPAPVAQSGNPGNLTALELQVARDIWQNGAAGFSEAQAIALARTQVKLADASSALARDAALGPVAQLIEAQAEQRRALELQSLAKNYPDVLTPKGYEELVKVRTENPWLDNSPEPWKAAAQILVGMKGLNGQAGTVAIPNPTGAQNQPIPVSPSSPAPTNPLELNTPDQIAAHVKTLSKDQEAEFWKKAGFKWDVPRAAFKGF